MFGPRGGNVEVGGGPDQSCQIVTMRDAGRSPTGLFVKLALGTGTLSQIRTKLCDWAVWQARAGCFSQAALYSYDSMTL